MVNELKRVILDFFRNGSFLLINQFSIVLIFTKDLLGSNKSYSLESYTE